MPTGRWAWRERVGGGLDGAAREGGWLAPNPAAGIHSRRLSLHHAECVFMMTPFACQFLDYFLPGPHAAVRFVATSRISDELLR